MITGVRYLVAIRTASSAMSKQSEGVAGATMATGDSPLRPYSAMSRSACSVLVGIPVDGPARWMCKMIRGSSPDTLLLQHHAGAGGGPDAERPAEGRAKRRADPADLVFGLERADPEPL